MENINDFYADAWLIAIIQIFFLYEKWLSNFHFSWRREKNCYFVKICNKIKKNIALFLYTTIHARCDCFFVAAN